MKLDRIQIKIKDGNIYLKSDSHRKVFKRWLSQYDGKEIYLHATEKKSQRSHEQNAYYWLYLGIIAEETGHTTEELHAFFKGMFLTKEIKDVLGKKTRLTISTTELSKGEFIEYLYNIEAETGVKLPDTSDYWGYSYHK